MEVLNIARDINENIYQAVINLTEEWEKLGSSRATSRMHADPTSGPRIPALVWLVRNRDPTGLTFLLQSCLCSQVANITSSWGRHRELAILVSIYQRLSTSEGQAISTRYSSTRQSFQFVRTVALERLETIIQRSLRLELVFMVEVTSGDMSLLFEAADTVFDNARMTNDFESDGNSTPKRRGRVAGTVEVNVGKGVGGGLAKVGAWKFWRRMP